MADLGKVLETFRPVLATKPNDNRFVHTLGSLLYRTGDWRGAIEAVERSIAIRQDAGHVLDWVFLVLAHRRLGNIAEARRWLEKARRWDDLEPDQASFSSWRERVQIRALIDEAERLVEETPP